MRHLAVCALVLVGCSPDLTCGLLADPSNCFAQQVAALADCMPMRTTPAALSTDGTTCTFADGVRVVFNVPVSALGSHVTDPTGIRFTVLAPDGATCGTLRYFENTDDFLAVNQAGWTERYPDDGSADSYELVCGSRAYDSSVADVLACQPPVDTPTFQHSLAGAVFSVAIVSAAPTLTFTCR